MSRLTYIRVVGYIAAIVMHVSNILYMGWFTKRAPSKDPQLENFRSLEFRFFTSWTFMLQVAYALFALGCDLVMLKNSKKKDFKLPIAITDFRDIVFAGLVWPCSMVVFTFFWSLYLYDRALIFPEHLDSIIKPISNHIMHTMIVPVAIWEVLFRPRVEPDNHARNVMQLTLHLCVYFSVLYFTYIEKGIWLYPIFRKLFGTIYFVPALAIIAGIFYLFYYLQWPLTKMIHTTKKKTEKKKAKLEKKMK